MGKKQFAFRGCHAKENGSSDSKIISGVVGLFTSIHAKARGIFAAIPHPACDYRLQ
jgi:hypothetical protein